MWYTPVPVVNVIVGDVDVILKTRLSLVQGIAKLLKTTI
jgi:hypothetical protein